MATDKPRITITLTPSSHAVLSRLAALTKQSQSGIVGDMIEQAEPLFERTVRLLEAAAIARDQAKGRVIEGMAAAQEVIERQLGLMAEDLGERTDDLFTGLESVSRRASPALPPRSGGGVGKPRKPPLLTGGSHVTPITRKRDRKPSGRKAPAKGRRRG